MSTTPAMRRRVVCGRSLTMLTFWPTRALTSVDLPTLGRPRTATKPERKPGGGPSGQPGRRPSDLLARRAVGAALAAPAHDAPPRRREGRPQEVVQPPGARRAADARHARRDRRTPRAPAGRRRRAGHRRPAMPRRRPSRLRSPAVAAAPSATRSAHMPARDTRRSPRSRRRTRAPRRRPRRRRRGSVSRAHRPRRPRPALAPAAPSPRAGVAAACRPSRFGRTPGLRRHGLSFLASARSVLRTA